MTKTEMKIAALTAALIKAKEAGTKYTDIDDGGTCNFDSPKIYLPRWRQKDVEKACENAGLRCFVYTLWGSKAYVICGGPLSSGQGDRRSKIAEVMYESLKADGYDAGMYYQMD